MLFIDASREYETGTNQNRLGERQIDKIVATLKARQSIDQYAYVAKAEEIAANDFNLNIPRYVDTFTEEEEIDLTAVRAERLKLEIEMAALETKMERYLQELGYV